MTFRDLTAFFSFCCDKNLVFFQIFLLRSIKAYLCANIINFDSADVSGRRPEEVISFLLTLIDLYLEDQEKTEIITKMVTMIAYIHVV